MLELLHRARNKNLQMPLGTDTESMTAPMACSCLHLAGFVALESLNMMFCSWLHNKNHATCFKKTQTVRSRAAV